MQQSSQISHIGPAFAATAAALVSLGGSDPAKVAAALHGGLCLACRSGGCCANPPSEDEEAYAFAFVSTLEVLAGEAPASSRAYRDNLS